MKTLVHTADPLLRGEFEFRLAAAGFRIFTSDDLAAAWQICCRERPTQYIVHWPAGDKAALDFCRRVRAAVGEHLCLIWVVSEQADQRAADIIAAGADDYLLLPIDWQRFSVRLAAARRRISDIHHREQVEEALRLSNERFDLAVRGANEGLWDALIKPGVPWYSPETSVWYSPRFKELLGFADDEFPHVLASWYSLLHPDDRPTIMAALAEHVGRRKPYDVEYRLKIKSGEYRWFSARGLGIWDDAGDMVRMAGSIRDVTDARRTADELRTSEEKWRGLVENAPDYVLVVDVGGRIRFLNRVGPDYTMDEVLGADVASFSPPDDRGRTRKAIQSVIDTGEPAQLESAVARPDGKIAWYSSRLGPIKRDGRVEGVVIITTDTTARKLAEEERQKFFALVENSGDFIGMLNSEGELLYVNPGGCKMIGIDNPTAAHAKPLGEFLTPDCRQRFEETALPEVISSGRWAGEMQFRHCLSGRLIDTHQKVFLVCHPMSGEPLGLATITRDISDRKRAEAALVREQEFLRRLLDLQERDRQLVAYEIHDGLVQEMTGALMHLEAFKHAEDSSQREHEFERGSGLLREAVNEARRLISGLRPPVLDELGVIPAVEYLINEVQPDVGEIEFVHRTSFDRLVPPLESAIFRIVQEGLNNVRKHSGSSKARVELYQTEKTLRLIIRDWGCGFDTAKVSTDRFGLQGIRQRARLLGSTAVIESTPGRGTVITVDLPLIPVEDDDRPAVRDNGADQGDIEDSELTNGSQAGDSSSDSGIETPANSRRSV